MRITTVLFCIILNFLLWSASWADIEFVGELTYGPKRYPSAAMPGEVVSEREQSSSVRMLDAEVDIYIGEKTESPDEKIPINGKGAFTLENQSDADARIVIGFPLGDREYSQYGLESFTASNDGQPAPVYVATSGNKLPWRLFHLSSELTGGEMKAVDISDSQFPALKDVLMSGEPVSQLLLWEASIPAMTARVVEINYTLNIPWQSPEVFTRHVEGNKEVRRVMKDSISSEWLKVLDDKKKYLFFDYILATGATWKGEIGKEEIRIHLDSSWQGKEPQLFVANRDSDIESVHVVSWEQEIDDGKVVVFHRSEFEPITGDDLFFALE